MKQSHRGKQEMDCDAVRVEDKKLMKQNSWKNDQTIHLVDKVGSNLKGWHYHSFCC